MRGKAVARALQFEQAGNLLCPAQYNALPTRYGHCTVKPEIKRRADALFSRLRMTTSTAMNILLMYTLEHRGFPHGITLGETRTDSSAPNAPLRCQSTAMEESHIAFSSNRMLSIAANCRGDVGFAGVDALAADKQRTVGRDSAANAARRTAVRIRAQHGNLPPLQEIEFRDFGKERPEARPRPLHPSRFNAAQQSGKHGGTVEKTFSLPERSLSDVARDAISGGNSVWFTFTPIPATILSPRREQRIPQSFLPQTKMSFGHLRPGADCGGRNGRSTSQTASPAAMGNVDISAGEIPAQSTTTLK